MFCGNCGNQLADDAAFCGKCGKPLDKAPAEEITTAPVPTGEEPVAETSPAVETAGEADTPAPEPVAPEPDPEAPTEELTPEKAPVVTPPAPAATAAEPAPAAAGQPVPAAPDAFTPPPVTAAPASAFGAPSPAVQAPVQAPAQPATAFEEPVPSMPQSAFAAPVPGAGAPMVPPESAFGPSSAGAATAIGPGGAQTKSKVPLLVAIIAVVAAIAIGVLVYQNTGDRVFTRLLNRQAAALESADAQTLLDISAEVALWGDDLFYYMTNEEAVDELAAELRELRYEYGSDLKVTHKLISAERMDPLEMSWLLGGGYFYGNSMGAEVEEVAVLYVYTTFEGSYDRDANQHDMYAAKVDGKWYLFMDGTY